MRSSFEFLTFDCYGTLIDWETGIATAFAKLASGGDPFADRRRVLKLYARFEPEVQAEEYRCYREVLDHSAARVAAALGSEIPAGRREFLSASLPSWPPFADTVPALRSLQSAGYRIGILSNVDDDLLAATLEWLPVDFELLVTAEQVGCYKPAIAHFVEARRRIGEVPWLHVAQSYFHDVRPAVAMQLPVVWINRRAEPPTSDARPLAEFPDLASFAAELTGSREPADGSPRAS